MTQTPHAGCESTDRAAHAFVTADAHWEQFGRLMPARRNTHRFGGGRPRDDDRRCLDGILFVPRTGC